MTYTAMSDICLLDEYGFLELNGTDALSFLQGYSTCDLDALDDDHVQMGAICNIQGRMLTSFLAVKTNDGLVLRMNRKLIEQTMAFLSKYIVFSKANMQDISDSMTCYGLQDDSQSRTPMTIERDGNKLTVHLGNRLESWLPSGEKPAADGHGDRNGGDWRRAELDAGVVWVTDRTSEKFLPQMFNYHNLDAIDFDKGCYLGQEIVARIHYRGEMKRGLHHLTSGAPRLVGDSLDKGEVVAVAGNACLAVIQNSTDNPVEVQFPDGETVTARLV